jgi:hypothetical protein
MPVDSEPTDVARSFTELVMPLTPVERLLAVALVASTLVDNEPMVLFVVFRPVESVSIRLVDKVATLLLAVSRPVDNVLTLLVVVLRPVETVFTTVLAVLRPEERLPTVLLAVLSPVDMLLMRPAVPFASALTVLCAVLRLTETLETAPLIPLRPLDRLVAPAFTVSRPVDRLSAALSAALAPADSVLSEAEAEFRPVDRLSTATLDVLKPVDTLFTPALAVLKLFESKVTVASAVLTPDDRLPVALFTELIEVEIDPMPVDTEPDSETSPVEIDVESEVRSSPPWVTLVLSDDTVLITELTFVDSEVIVAPVGEVDRLCDKEDHDVDNESAKGVNPFDQALEIEAIAVE